MRPTADFVARFIDRLQSRGKAGPLLPTGVGLNVNHRLHGLRLARRCYDVGLLPRNFAESAGLFGHAESAVQPGAGHCPWLDDPAWFTQARAALLG